jgi:hypothetical protein
MQVFNYHYGYESTGFGLVVLLDYILFPNITASSLHHAYNGSTNALSNSKTGGPILQIYPKDHGRQREWRKQRLDNSPLLKCL